MCCIRVKNGDTNRARTGCKNQNVVGVLVALSVGHHAAVTVQLLCVAVVDQVDVLSVPQLGVAEGQVLFGIFEELLNGNAVVRGVGFIVQHGNGVCGTTGCFSTLVVCTNKTPCGGACTDNENVAGGVRHEFSFPSLRCNSSCIFTANGDCVPEIRPVTYLRRMRRNAKIPDLPR